MHIAEKISKMVNAMKQKELESIEALKRAADAEVELTSAKEKYGARLSLRKEDNVIFGLGFPSLWTS